MVHSAGVWPAPSPRIRRPSDKRSRVPASLANVSGSRSPALRTYVPSLRVDVTVAAALNATNGDGVTPDMVSDVQGVEAEIFGPSCQRLPRARVGDHARLEPEADGA